MSFDYVSFLRDNFGGVNEVFRAFPDGMVKRTAIEKWFSRGSVPTESFAFLVSTLSPALNKYWVID